MASKGRGWAEEQEERAGEGAGERGRLHGEDMCEAALRTHGFYCVAVQTAVLLTTDAPHFPIIITSILYHITLDDNLVTV